MHVTDAPAPGHDPHRAARKDDHVRLAEEQVNAGYHRNEFDDLTFVHHALGGVSAAEVDLAANAGPWRFATPFYVNGMTGRSEEHTSELQSRFDLVCRLLLEKKNSRRRRE